MRLHALGRFQLASLLGLVLSATACGASRSSTDNQPGSAGTAQSGADSGLGGDTGDAGGPTAAAAGASAEPSEQAEWPMPNAATLDLPNPASYDATSNPGVVHDDVTSLDWQQSPDTTLVSRADAVAVCDALLLGGFDDWHVPTFIELVSLFDAASSQINALGPSYIAPVFDASGAYWSTTESLMGAQYGRMVDFAADGCSATQLCTIGETADATQALGGAFCVRSTEPVSTEPRYDVTVDQVTDLRTGLIWLAPTSDLNQTHDAAQASCAALGNGARLPSMTELLSLLVPLLDPVSFPNWSSDDYAWSSSTIAAKPGSFWIAGDTGVSDVSAATETHHVQCVR